MRIRFAKYVAGMVACIAVVGISLAGDAVKSGLKPGEPVNPFTVEDVTGPSKGTSLCYRCQYGSAAVVCVFARKTSDPLASLVKKIDKKIAENGDLKSFVVVIPKKDEKVKDSLEKLAKDSSIKNVPLTIDYEISQEGDVTVLMWKDGKVRVNHAYKGELTDKDVDAVVADIPKVLAD
jgi:hypothetical protein